MKTLFNLLLFLSFVFGVMSCQEVPTNTDSPSNDIDILETPYGLISTAISYSQVRLEWECKEDKYVYQSSEYQDFNDKSDENEGTISYTESAFPILAKPETKYYFRVKSMGENSYSSWSNTADATTFEKPLKKITIDVNADTYVDSVRPDTNYGDIQYIATGNYDSFEGISDFSAIMRFSIGISLPEDITVMEVKLGMYPVTLSSPVRGKTDVYSIASAIGWSEMGITYNNIQEKVDLIASEYVDFSSNNMHYWDITEGIIDEIQNYNSVGFIIKTSDITLLGEAIYEECRFYSKELSPSTLSLEIYYEENEN